MRLRFGIDPTGTGDHSECLPKAWGERSARAPRVHRRTLVSCDPTASQCTVEGESRFALCDSALDSRLRSTRRGVLRSTGGATAKRAHSAPVPAPKIHNRRRQPTEPGRSNPPGLTRIHPSRFPSARSLNAALSAARDLLICPSRKREGNSAPRPPRLTLIVCRQRESVSSRRWTAATVAVIALALWRSLRWLTTRPTR